jgi:hypothetical protein
LPDERRRGPAGAIELAVEFFVPPISTPEFAHELDRALMRRSMPYSAARRANAIDPIRLAVVPPGTFHQWRAGWRISLSFQQERRWSLDRSLIDTLLRQAETGWREEHGKGDIQDIQNFPIATGPGMR